MAASKDPKTYISRSNGKFRIIHQGGPLTADTDEAGVRAYAAKHGLDLSHRRVWDGDLGSWADDRPRDATNSEVTRPKRGDRGYVLGNLTKAGKVTKSSGGMVSLRLDSGDTVEVPAGGFKRFDSPRPSTPSGPASKVAAKKRELAGKALAGLRGQTPTAPLKASRTFGPGFKDRSAVEEAHKRGEVVFRDNRGTHTGVSVSHGDRVLEIESIGSGLHRVVEYRQNIDGTRTATEYGTRVGGMAQAKQIAVRAIADPTGTRTAEETQQRGTSGRPSDWQSVSTKRFDENRAKFDDMKPSADHWRRQGERAAASVFRGSGISTKAPPPIRTPRPYVDMPNPRTPIKTPTRDTDGKLEYRKIDPLTVRSPSTTIDRAVTDYKARQDIGRIAGSIREGQLILKSGTSNGRRMTPGELAAVERDVKATRGKLARLIVEARKEARAAKAAVSAPAKVRAPDPDIAKFEARIEAAAAKGERGMTTPADLRRFAGQMREGAKGMTWGGKGDLAAAQAAENVAKKMEAGAPSSINPGDRVRFDPSSKHGIAVEGAVVEQINNGFGGIGYHVLSPTADDPSRVVRVWQRDGAVSVLSAASPAPTERSKESAMPAAKSGKPYVALGDLMDHYKSLGLSRDRAWTQYVQDTILQPQLRSESTDAKEFLAGYDKARPVPHPALSAPDPRAALRAQAAAERAASVNPDRAKAIAAEKARIAGAYLAVRQAQVGRAVGKGFHAAAVTSRRNDRLSVLTPEARATAQALMRSGHTPARAMAKAIAQHMVQTGPRGGRYYVTASGNRRYVRPGSLVSAHTGRRKAAT